MHSSYALASSEFSVERDGASSPLADLWPGYRPDDRLGIVLANPMDACGCSNLICGTNTLFYDHLRDTRGVGNFFRYADTYLFGVGCEPGDFNQLDVWPLHKFVTVLQPTAEALIEMLNDRRITLLAIPDTGARCRGEVVLSTWNTYLETVRCVVTYSPRTGKARDADVTLVGNRVVESYVEQAIFTTPGIGAGEQARLRRLRRNLDREPMQCAESYRSLPNASQPAITAQKLATGIANGAEVEKPFPTGLGWLVEGSQRDVFRNAEVGRARIAERFLWQGVKLVGQDLTPVSMVRFAMGFQGAGGGGSLTSEDFHQFALTVACDAGNS